MGGRPLLSRFAPRMFVYVGYAVFSAFVLFPLAWIFLMSIKDFRDIIAYPPKFVFQPTLENYSAILFGEATPGLTTGISDYVRFLRNSVIISGLAVGLSAVVGIPAGYSLARSKLALRRELAFTFLSFRFAPELAVILPLYLIYKNLNLYDTYLGMILVNQLITLPLVIWITMGFFGEIPVEIEEAAVVDGANPWQILWRIAVPLAVPGIASSIILAFIASWNNLIFGLVLAGGQTQPVTLGILQTMTFDQIKWGWMVAAAVIAAVPGMAVAIYFERYLVRGLTMGAVR